MKPPIEYRAKSYGTGHAKKLLAEEPAQQLKAKAPPRTKKAAPAVTDGKRYIVIKRDREAYNTYMRKYRKDHPKRPKP